MVISNIQDDKKCWLCFSDLLAVSLEEGMATHSSILAWRIPWAEEPGRLQSIGLQKVGHDCQVTEQTHKLIMYDV